MRPAFISNREHTHIPMLCSPVAILAFEAMPARSGRGERGGRGGRVANTGDGLASDGGGCAGRGRARGRGRAGASQAGATAPRRKSKLFEDETLASQCKKLTILQPSGAAPPVPHDEASAASASAAASTVSPDASGSSGAAPPAEASAAASALDADSTVSQDAHVQQIEAAVSKPLPAVCGGGKADDCTVGGDAAGGQVDGDVAGDGDDGGVLASQDSFFDNLCASSDEQGELCSEDAGDRMG